MNRTVYKIVGWSQRPNIGLGSCCFSIELDIEFAKQARKLQFTDEQQHRFEEIIREMIGHKYVGATFLDDTAFLRSMSVKGNCACLGVDGSTIDANWSNEGIIIYHGHNVDNKIQAFDLLSIFLFWIETVEAYLTI